MLIAASRAGSLPGRGRPRRCPWFNGRGIQHETELMISGPFGGYDLRRDESSVSIELDNFFVLGVLVGIASVAGGRARVQLV